MNYRHGFHAGSFCDVFKHTILISLIKSLQKKDNAFCCLDTHAGRGMYDLKSLEAQKSKEYEKGIKKIWQAQQAPSVIQEYLESIKAINPDNILRYYPGSPLFTQDQLRPQDRAIFIEKHPAEQRFLKRQLRNNKQGEVHLLDAYQSLKAFLPPKERRGLVFIDPPYELDDLAQLAEALPPAIKRFSTGVYALWYPIKLKADTERFYRRLQNALQLPFLISELCIYPPDNPLHLNGCGMIIINPPWQLKNDINTYLPWIWEQLKMDANGYHRIFKYA